MQTLDNDSVHLDIAAPVDELYALITDVTRMPELSPEVTRCVWLDGATAAAVGVRFAATNKVSRGPAWTNRPVVTVVESGRTFAFARTERFSGTVEWRYDFEPRGDATTITESYKVTKPIGRIGWFVIGTLFGCHDRRAELRRGMEQTLRRVREVAERGLGYADRQRTTTGNPGGKSSAQSAQSAQEEGS